MPAGRAIFLCGASRSGTALLRSICNASPLVHIAGETHYFDDLRSRLGSGATSPLPPELATLAADYFLALADRPYGHGGDASRSRLPSDLLHARAAALGGTGDAYFEAFCQLQAGVEGRSETPVWGEKTPRHVLRLGEILALYPRAQAIVMVRDPRAVIASYRDWRRREEQESDTPGDPGLEAERRRTEATYDPTIASMAWRASIAAARVAADQFGSRVRIQRYEDLVTDPDHQVEEICRWLDIPFSRGMLEVPLHNSSFSAFQPAEGISTAPLRRWVTTLTDQEVAVVQMWCGRQMARLGYERVDVSSGLAVRSRAMASGGLSAVRALRANRDRAGGSLPRYVARRVRLALTR